MTYLKKRELEELRELAASLRTSSDSLKRQYDILRRLEELEQTVVELKRRQASHDWRHGNKASEEWRNTSDYSDLRVRRSN